MTGMIDRILVWLHNFFHWQASAWGMLGLGILLGMLWSNEQRARYIIDPCRRDEIMVREPYQRLKKDDDPHIRCERTKK
jgi:hypothetical protein